MSDSSLTIYGRQVSRWTEPGQDGLTIAVTFMASQGSLSSARINELSHYLDGSENSSLNAKMLEPLLGLLYTRSAELLTRESSTPRSHSECWCNCSEKRATNEDAH